MKKFLRIAASFAFLALAGQSAQAGTYSEYNLTLDVSGQGALGGPSNISLTSGVGGSIFADWRPLESIAFGGGFSFADYLTGSWQTCSFDLGGKIFPFGSDNSGEFYIQPMFGYNLIQDSLNHSAPGNFHGGAALGYSAFVLGPGMALDLGLKYDIYTPVILLAPLHDVGIKAGVTWNIGQTLGGK